MNSKEKLYYLLEKYLKGDYSTKLFSELFSDTYNLETDYDSLSVLEREFFSELSIITGRFSPFEDDLKKYDCYYNEEQVKEKVKEVVGKLNL